MSDDIDIDKHADRAHELTVVTMVCRYALASIVAFIALLGWRCNGHRSCRAGKTIADVDAAANLARALECERWTP